MLLQKMISLMVTLSIVLTAVSFAQAQDSHSHGLQTAIRTALEKNPKIKSNDKVLEAMLLRVESAKLSQLPSLRVGYSASRFVGALNESSAGQVAYNRTSRSGDVSLNWNVFDGGARRKRIQSMECSFKERQATYNSTNTQIRNTQGQIASVVVQNYVALTRSKQNIEFDMQLLQILGKFRTSARTQGEISETENAIGNFELDLKEQQANLTKAADNFQYVVTEAPPADLDSFQQMIENLNIPASPELAIQISLEKSPEIKSARFQIECARLRHASAKASAYSPRVDVSVGRSMGNQLSGNSASISISMNFDAGTSSELKAQAKEIDSAQDNLDGTLADTKHDIDSSYPDLINAINFAESYNKNFMTSQINIQKYIQDIDAHKPIAVTDAVKELGNLINNFYSYQRYTILVLNTKFQIQKTVGTLFESLGLQEFGTSQMSVQ